MFKLNENGYLAETEYELADEPLLASLFTTGNGYMGVRGSFEEYASQRIQGAFVRGYIDEITEVCEPFADNEYMKKYYLNEEGLKQFQTQESCVNMPDFTMVRIEIGGKTFFPWEGKLLGMNRVLDTRTATLARTATWDDGLGNVTELTFERFASFECDHLFCQRVTVKPVNHKLPVRIISGVDTAVKTGGQFITEVTEENFSDGDMYLAFNATNKYKFKAAYLIKNVFPSGKADIYRENGRVGAGVTCNIAPEYTFTKFTYVVTQRDTTEPLQAFVKGLAAKYPPDYNKRVAAHKKAYAQYFAPMDVTIEGDSDADGWLRFASYHTAISADRHSSVHGVAAKGLSGERYNQFVWWDCEIHQLPFFLFTAPETAKHLLMYRYNRLDQSRKNAAECGYKGAKFAFCSSVTGDERVWGYVRHPFMQVHINSDIPMGVINYYNATGDTEFMRGYGMELMHECIRFWLGRVTEAGGRYEIKQVTGTDEHHPYVDNDAYTNYCVEYVMRKFICLCEELGYNVEKEELAEIKDVQARLYLPVCRGGMIPQFDGYFDLSRGLEEAGKGTLKQFQMKKSGLYHRSQIIKQPDVALLYTFADVELNREHYAQNWDYYEKMCETSSSLTFPVHAVASAHNRRMLSFYDYFMDSLKIDADDIHGVGWQGVHSGCLAGGYLAVVYGLMGMRVAGGKLSFDPNPMPFFKKVTAHIKFRGRDITVSLAENKFGIKITKGDALKVSVCGRQYDIADFAEFNVGSAAYEG